MSQEIGTISLKKRRLLAEDREKVNPVARRTRKCQEIQYSGQDEPGRTQFQLSKLRLVWVGRCGEIAIELPADTREDRHGQKSFRESPDPLFRAFVHKLYTLWCRFPTGDDICRLEPGTTKVGASWINPILPAKRDSPARTGAWCWPRADVRCRHRRKPGKTLCRAYWYPLYAYARRCFGDIATAQDYTQDFFARLLEKNILAVADPERGCFRGFLLIAFKNFLANEAEKTRARKRGGGQALLPLDFQAGDSRYELEPSHAWTPERVFERQWALTLLQQVMSALRAEDGAAGKEPLFDGLKGSLAGETDTPYAMLAEKLGTSEGAIKQAAHRLRQRYREILRREIATDGGRSLGSGRRNPPPVRARGTVTV